MFGPYTREGFTVIRFLVNVDELAALVRARAILADDGQIEFADTLTEMLADAALDVSAV